jgi:hypothetical protein
MHNSEAASALQEDLAKLATKQLDKLSKRMLNPFDKESEVTDTDRGEMFMLLMSVVLPAYVTADQIEANWKVLTNSIPVTSDTAPENNS